MTNRKKIIALLFTIGFLFWSCDYGKLGGADITGTYYPGDKLFDERLTFLSGLWYSYYAGIGLLDSYRIRKWSELTENDKVKAQSLFPSMNINNPKTYSTKDTPIGNDYYFFLYDDTVYGQEEDIAENYVNWGFCYMGLVRAINIFNNDKNRGAIIIEYFEGADPAWLSDPDGYSYQGLEPGEKPFFGIYFKVINQNTIQLANPVDQAALNAGKLYYTEQETLSEAVEIFDVENEAEFIIWGVVTPFNRH